MTDKRTLSTKWIRSDKFAILPLRAQGLFLQLYFCADEEGVVKNPGIVMKSVGARHMDLNPLLSSGVVKRNEVSDLVITDWSANFYNLNKYVPKSKRNDTQIVEEAELAENPPHTPPIATDYSRIPTLKRTEDCSRSTKIWITEGIKVDKGITEDYRKGDDR